MSGESFHPHGDGGVQPGISVYEYWRMEFASQAMRAMLADVRRAARNKQEFKDIARHSFWVAEAMMRMSGIKR